MTPLILVRLSVPTLPIPGSDPWSVAPEDPALRVMTDFRDRSSVVVAESLAIDDALEHMKHAGVRSAFVTDDRSREVIGLVTAYDIIGEKPVLHGELTSTPRREIGVREIMQRAADWHVVDVEALSATNVAAVAATFEQTGLTHVPVVETGASGQTQLRGLLSSAKVRKLLAGVHSSPLHAPISVMVPQKRPAR